jgi:hypothetical protein
VPVPVPGPPPPLLVLPGVVLPPLLLPEARVPLLVVPLPPPLLVLAPPLLLLEFGSNPITGGGPLHPQTGQTWPDEYPPPEEEFPPIMPEPLDPEPLDPAPPLELAAAVAPLEEPGRTAS